jgi:hypothetical protein
MTKGVCRACLPRVEDGRRSSLRGNLWSCLAIDERKVLLDVVDSWDKMMEPNGFAMPNPPRTSRSSCSRVKPSFAHAHVPLKHVWHTRVTSCRTVMLGCIEAPPSSPRLTATFAPQLLLPTCLVVTVTFDLPPLLPACCPSCISRASELVSSTRPLLHHQIFPWRS